MEDGAYDQRRSIPGASRARAEARKLVDGSPVMASPHDTTPQLQDRAYDFRRSVSRDSGRSRALARRETRGSEPSTHDARIADMEKWRRELGGRDVQVHGNRITTRPPLSKPNSDGAPVQVLGIKDGVATFFRIPLVVVGPA